MLDPEQSKNNEVFSKADTQLNRGEVRLPFALVTSGRLVSISEAQREKRS
jgi:hypothetical protein